MDVLKSNLVADSCEKALPNSAPAADNGGRDHKGDHAVAHGGDAHALRRDAVIANSQNRAAGAAADQIENDDEGDHDQQEASEEGRDGIGTRGSLRALDDSGARLGKAQVVNGKLAGEVEQHVDAVLVHANDEAGDDLLDNLAERERHDGQVVAG